MTTPAERFRAIVADALAFPGIERDTGFRVLETRAVDAQAVVVGETLQHGAVIGYAMDAADFATLFDNLAIAADAFANELIEPGGCGEPPSRATAAVIEARYPGIRWITPELSLHAVLTGRR